jgi:hypothetical protein
MARGRKVKANEVTDLKPTTASKREPEWYSYIQDIDSLEAYPDAIEYTPDDNESMRTIKNRVTRAAKSLDKTISKRETQRGTLLVFQPPTEGRRGRGGRGRSAQG